MSNKTQKASGGVTVSALNRRTYIICGTIVFVFGFFILGIIKKQTPSHEIRAKISGRQVLLEVADNEVERQKGLSFRTELSADQGMIFVFDKPGKQCFWMKDMNLSLDILWFDEQKNMIHHEHDVSPSTYPRSFCATNTKYVVELNSGSMKRLGIGETAVLEL